MELFLDDLFPTANAVNPEEEAPGVTTPVIPKPDFLPGPSEETTTSGTATQDFLLNETIPQVINIVTGLLGILAFIGILVAAVNMLTAYGNEEKYNRAKTTLRYSITGFLIVMLSYAIVSIVVSIALPSESDTSFFYNTAYAVDVNDIDTFLPAEDDLIGDEGHARGVSLPSGDFLSEVVPAAITNVFYFVGFLVFIALMTAGVLLVIGRGNEEMITKAKRIATYGAIAIALIALGYAIIFGIATLNLNQDDQTDSDDVFVEEPEND
ncbi:MAG: pilin [Patescibacteria group bacterium]